jgi:predicted transcriptional regulator
MFRRGVSTLKGNSNAITAWKNSCYHKIDFKINQNSKVYEAVQKFSAYNIGCLAVTNDANKVIGVISERDYISKIALLGKKSQDTPVSEICTFEPNICLAFDDDDMQACMNKMLIRNTRHLLILDRKQDEIIGLLSIKDLIKEILAEKNKVIKNISNLNVGLGGYYEHV